MVADNLATLETGPSRGFSTAGARFGMRMRLGLPYSRTEVTETFDWSVARSPRAIELLGFPARNRRGIEATLDRLAARFG